jgi:putative glutamine amidotransferase
MKIIGLLGNYFRPERLGAPSPFGAYYLNKDYVDSFTGSAVLPVTVPYLSQPRQIELFLDLISGLVLTGGFDIPSCYFQEKELPKVNFTYDLERAEFELKLLKHCSERSLPVFGICMGLQMFNIFRGGTLIQDIPSQTDGTIDHSLSSSDPKIRAHWVEIQKDSRLHQIMGTNRVEVNSSHHQAIDKLGEGLEVCARSEDGVIEAIECKSGLFLGVQWHPESLQYHDSQQANLFKDFVAGLA